MEKNYILALIAETLELDLNLINFESILIEIPQWDSMAKLSLTILFAEKFNIKIDNLIIKSFVTIGDIVNYIK